MKKTVYGGREMNARKGRDRKHLWIMLCAVMVIGLGIALMPQTAMAIFAPSPQFSVHGGIYYEPCKTDR